jgi:general secretion pathway protein L
LADYRLAEGIVSTTLRIFIGEHWPERPSTRWALMSATGELIRQGESDGLHWPTAEVYEAVLSAPQVSCLRAQIPERVSKPDLPRVVASAIEDRLLEDPDQCHLTLYGRQKGTVNVLVVSRARLRNVLAQFGALRRPLSALYSELQFHSLSAREWLVVLATNVAILSRPEETPLVLDLPDDGMPPPLLQALLGNVRAEDGEPELKVRAEPGRNVDLVNWRTLLHTQKVTIGPEYAWYRLDSKATDLLHGEFASRQRRSGVWLLVKPAVVIAALFLLTYVAVGIVQLGLQYYRVSQLDGRMTELFRAAFPNVPVMAPSAQTRRSLDHLRATHGLLRSDDALTLLAAVSEVLGSEGQDAIQEVKYENHRLTVIFPSGQAERMDSLRRQLTARGYLVTANAAPQGLPSFVVEPDLTR